MSGRPEHRPRSQVGTKWEVAAGERPLPWSDSCFVCGEQNPKGLGLRFSTDGEVVMLRANLDPLLQGYPGHVHGGIISAMLDEAMGWACSVAAHRMHYTVDLKIRYRRPVPAGEPIVVKARMLERDIQVAHGWGRIENGAGKLLVTGEGRFYPLSEEEHEQLIPMLKMPGRPARPEDI